MTKMCGRRSKFGVCGRRAGHKAPFHAVPVGDRVWFGWLGRTVLGYGYVPHGRFRKLGT